MVTAPEHARERERDVCVPLMRGEKFGGEWREQEQLAGGWWRRLNKAGGGGGYGGG
jgi:hypothetical protein